jgi:hypothetical protein
MPTPIRPEAQQWLASLTKVKSGEESLADRRAHTDAWRKFGSAEARNYYPVNVEKNNCGCARGYYYTPRDADGESQSRADQSAWRWIQFGFGLPEK